MSSCAVLEAQVSAKVVRGKQDSKAVSLVRRAWLGVAPARKARVCMQTKRVKSNQSEQVGPLAEPRGSSHAFFCFLF